MKSPEVPLWRVISGLGITQIIGWGTTYYLLGALSPDFAAATGWSKTLIFGAFSAALLLSGVISRSAGRAIDKIGARRVMSAGSIIAAIGLLLMGLTSYPAFYVTSWLLLGVAMRLTTYDAAFAALAHIVPHNTRRAISYLTLFGGLASTVFWPLGHWLSARFGLQATLLIYAALHLLICLPIHMTVLAGHGDLSDHGGEPAAMDLAPPLEGRERRWAMALFATALSLNGLVFSAISAHVVPLFQGLGFAGAEAVIIAAFIGPAQVASRIGDIAMGRNVKATQLGVVAFALLPFALLVFAGSGFATLAAFAFALLYGMSNGIITIAKGAVPLVLFGRRGYGLVLGTLAAPTLILNSLSPTLFAMLLDRTSSATGMIVALVFALLSTAAMVMLARRYPR